jgi:cation:H+ antiporter
MEYLFLLAGIVLLLLGGDFLVRAAVELSLRLKISILVVGMTVVSFATSAPELLVSLKAAYLGFSDIAFGNVIGSNIANISLILGLTAMIFPIMVKPTTYKVDWWIMMGATALLFAFIGFDNKLGTLEALVLVAALVWYNVFQIRSSRKQTRQQKEAPPELETPAKRLSLPLAFFFLIGGVAALKFGSDFLVDGAVVIARQWNISERVIGLTIVSVGTSLPELAASLVASFKGEQELSLGNLIGSNIFNILAVLGLTGLIVEIPVESQALLTFDFPVLIGISLLLYPFMVWVTRGSIARWEGAALLVCYALYVFFIFQ